MLLRRVIEHIRKQEWTAIAIDFVIVVLGVFVGIQVSNLNTARLDRAAEAAFLVRLSKEIDMELHTTEALLNQGATRAQGLENAILIMQSDVAGVSLSPEQCFAAWASHILQDTFQFNGLLSVEALSQSRGLETVNDAELHSTLINYQRQMALHQSTARFTLEDAKDLIEDFSEVFPRRLNKAGQTIFFVECKLEEMRANPYVQERLMSNYARLNTIILDLRTQVNLLRDLQSMVNENVRE